MRGTRSLAKNAMNVVGALKETPHAVTAMIPDKATPPEALPGVIVWRYTAGALVCWAFATLHHLLESAAVQFDHHWWAEMEHVFETESGDHGGESAEHSEDHESPHFRFLQAEWPQPQGLFEVNTLHCDLAAAASAERRIFVGNRFGLHSAQLSAVGAPLYDFEEVSETSVALLWCSGDGGCQTFHQDDESSWLWSLTPLGESNIAGKEHIPVPSSWRLVAASTGGAGCHSEPCPTMVLAGWDGTEVIIADAERSVMSGSEASWQFSPRLAVHPEVALRPTPSTPMWLRRAVRQVPLQNYSDVRALQVGEGGRTLAVLADSNGQTILDGWDLLHGTLVGRWVLHGQYDAMCHDGNEMYLASRNGEGAVLFVGSLPRPLRDKSELRIEL